jgi:GT2 family glycosyltransferase
VNPARVGAVVLNYNGGEVTLRCLRSLLATERGDHPLTVVLVDNASTDGIAARVRTELPTVTVLESETNRGFAGGCNLGIRALAQSEFVALINNDATVDPDWLSPLVAALHQDRGLGATCPKILFAGQFVDVTIEAPTHTRGRGDRRDLGVLVLGARVDGQDVWDRVQLVHGFWGREPVAGSVEGEWTAASAQLRLPVNGPGSHAAELRLAAGSPAQVRVSSGGRDVKLEVEARPVWHPVPMDAPPLTIVNNVGTDLNAGGYGVNRGYVEPNDGRFERAEDVFAWCGAAVLLRREYLEDVGLFDERLFLYYEDLELAWRGRRRGWRYRYIPDAVVRHLHGATSDPLSTLKHYFDERNRLLVLTRHAPLGFAGRAATSYLASTASYARRDILSPLLHARRPRPAIVGQRLRAFAGYVARAGGMVCTRAKDRRRGLQPARQSLPHARR